VLRGGETLPDLPCAAHEAATIARLYAAGPLTGPKATEAAVRGRAGRADVIHLATHGKLATYRAMSSGVLLSPPLPTASEWAGKTPTKVKAQTPALESQDDGVLQAWEIQSQLKLRAELVVLSACETGRGKHVRSEGIVGLVRALQAAGARSIVASQWPVGDASTEGLMVAFHQKLRTGVAKDEALRQAMEAVRQDPETADPRYWAAFFLVGDPANPNLGTNGKASAPSRKASGRKSPQR
jgi:CHAT domain-containing protein